MEIMYKQKAEPGCGHLIQAPRNHEVSQDRSVHEQEHIRQTGPPDGYEQPPGDFFVEQFARSYASCIYL